jgi:iron complex outermembrane recepter protein
MNPIAYSKACGFALSPLMISISLAQTPAPQTTQNNTLPPVIVTGNPFRDTELTQPALVIPESEIRRRSAASLGETLNSLPGISSTYFGPIASRPTIRGQDGDRIKVLNNSGTSFDVSSLSFDHAVPVNTMALERIEVLRGPASLLYGGNAIGGVINLIDRRIPRFESQTANGLKMRVELGSASADRAQQGNFAWHIDLDQQRRSQINVPILLTCERDGEAIEAKKLCNSQSTASDIGLGASVKLNNGYIGTSVSQYKTNYGSPAEDTVNIDMRSRRLMLEGQQRFNQPLGLQSIQWHVGRANYQHQELDGPELGTIFKSNGTDSRLELRYKALTTSQGVVGIQTEASRFEAIGEEAFLPPSTTRSMGLFVIQDWTQSWGRLSAGLRIDRIKVQSTIEQEQFTRQFSPLNFSVGGVFKLSPQLQLTTNLSSGQRAPKDYELFADGPHIATNAYEIGDANLKVEKYRSVDVGLRYKRDANTINASVYTTRFSNYVSLSGQSGLQLDDLPVYAYTAVPARFTGFELEWESQINSKWQVNTRADRTVATNLETNRGLPRIAPLRLGVSVTWTPSSAWQFDLGVDRSAAQNRIPEGEQITKGATLVNAAAQWNMQFGTTELSALLKIDNVSNRLAYSASSILTQTLPGRVPLPGRNVQLSLKAMF